MNKTIDDERDKSISCNESNATKLASVTPIPAGKNVNAPETRDVKYICVVNKYPKSISNARNPTYTAIASNRKATMLIDHALQTILEFVKADKDSLNSNVGMNLLMNLIFDNFFRNLFNRFLFLIITKMNTNKKADKPTITADCQRKTIASITQRMLVVAKKS